MQHFVRADICLRSAQEDKEIAMLILTRRPGESLVVDGHATVTVLGVKGRQVRIGITAPESVRVLRQEVSLRMQKEAAALESLVT
jgi:carbon storage regulator